jgi:hypothetical protein
MVVMHCSGMIGGSTAAPFSSWHLIWLRQFRSALAEQWLMRCTTIVGSLSVTALAQYVATWERMQDIQLALDREDKFVWKWTNNQQYSASSAYKAFFLG